MKTFQHLPVSLQISLFSQYKRSISGLKRSYWKHKLQLGLIPFTLENNKDNKQSPLTTVFYKTDHLFYLLVTATYCFPKCRCRGTAKIEIYWLDVLQPQKYKLGKMKGHQIMFHPLILPLGATDVEYLEDVLINRTC